MTWNKVGEGRGGRGGERRGKEVQTEVKVVAVTRV